MNSIVRSQCRLPRELNDWLTERARYESRSKNAQLIVERRERRAEMTERGLHAVSQAPVDAIERAAVLSHATG